MKKILTLAVMFFLTISGVAHADKNISQFTATTTIAQQDLIPYWSVSASSATATSNITLANFLQSFLLNGVMNICNANTSLANACTAYFGYASPIWFGAACNFSTDDSAGILAASNNTFNAPIGIPLPQTGHAGCHLLTKVLLTHDNVTFIGAQHAPTYNAKGGTNQSHPFIQVENGVGENQTIDSNGYDNFGWFGVDMTANFGYAYGTAAVGSSFPGHRNGVLEFKDIEDSAFSNFGSIFGVTTAADSTFTGGNMCSPDAYPSGTEDEGYFHNLRLGNSCFGFFANMADVYGDTIYMTSGVGGNCMASRSGFGIVGEFINTRCEYWGGPSFDGILQNNGAGVYFSGAGLGLDLVNAEFDHVYGPNVDMAGSANHLNIVGGWMFNNGAGSLVPAGFSADVVLESGASDFNWSGTNFADNTGFPTYGISTTGSVDYVSMTGMNAHNTGVSSWSHFTGAIAHLQQQVLGAPFIINGQNFGLGVGTSGPDAQLSLGGQSAETIDVTRELTAATAGNSLTLQAGGAVALGTDKNGGNLILSSGISTGAGISGILFKTFPAGSTGTADNTATTQMTLISSGNLGIGTATPAAKLDVNGTSIIIEQLTTPADNAACTAGQMWIDTGFIYICTASGTVKRATLATY